MVAEYKKVKIWASDPSLPVDGINRMVALMVESGIIKQAVTYEQIARPEFAQKALQSIKR